jgi:hypothetical protein
MLLSLVLCSTVSLGMAVEVISEAVAVLCDAVTLLFVSLCERSVLMSKYAINAVEPIGKRAGASKTSEYGWISRERAVNQWSRRRYPE